MFYFPQKSKVLFYAYCNKKETVAAYNSPIKINTYTSFYTYADDSNQFGTRDRRFKRYNGISYKIGIVTTSDTIVWQFNSAEDREKEINLFLDCLSRHNDHQEIESIPNEYPGDKLKDFKQIDYKVVEEFVIHDARLFSCFYNEHLLSESQVILIICHNPRWIKYIDNPSAEVCLTALCKDGYALQYISKPSPEMLNVAKKKMIGTTDYTTYIKNKNKHYEALESFEVA